MLNFRNALLPSLQRQRGGTVLGVIVGLIIGLGIAVVVAVMITKSTLPFTNKQAQPERAAGSGQIADPNKPLYGNKEPARQAAKNYAPEKPPENALITDAKPPVVEKSAGEKTKATEKAVADARLAAQGTEKAAVKTPETTGDKSAEKPAADKADSIDEKWIYFLQAGAFREPADAESAKAKLALMGFEANVTERPSDSGPLYRVRVGPFRQLEVMTRARSKLSDNGVDVAVVRSAR
ncbi:MAG: SPOR domain-containing protein [Pseudomonadota bacterium]